MRRPWLVLVMLMAVGPVAAQALRLDGEIAAGRSHGIAPPSVEGQWQYQITRLVPDGQRVAKGDVVVAFDAATLQRELQEVEGQLGEKRSEQQRLRLDLAERSRTTRLETAEQAAAVTKAARKATQPASLLRSVDYRKLVIDRDHSERRQRLVEARERAVVRQHAAEQALVDAEVAQLEADRQRLVAAIAAMQVKAPEDGIVLVRSGWRGERFEVGSQVFMGQAVAQIPDPTTLLVRATVPERDFLRLAVGQAVEVRVEGGSGRTLPGRITRLGNAVRSKSRRQPVPVVDVDVALAGDVAELRPGQAVSVNVPTPATGARP
jgi:multidrug resistance efflux pump